MCYDARVSCRQAGQSCWLDYKSLTSVRLRTPLGIITYKSWGRKALAIVRFNTKHQISTLFIVTLGHMSLGGLLIRPCLPQQTQHSGLTELKQSLLLRVAWSRQPPDKKTVTTSSSPSLLFSSLTRKDQEEKNCIVLFLLACLALKAWRIQEHGLLELQAYVLKRTWLLSCVG